jgi:acyl carrier protein
MSDSLRPDSGHAQSRHDQILVELKRIISEILQVPADVLTTDSKISDLPYVESIRLLRIAGKIERRFGIELENEVVFQRGSLSDITAEVTRLTLANEDSAA